MSLRNNIITTTSYHIISLQASTPVNTETAMAAVLDVQSERVPHLPPVPEKHRGTVQGDPRTRLPMERGSDRIQPDAQTPQAGDRLMPVTATGL